MVILAVVICVMWETFNGSVEYILNNIYMTRSLIQRLSAQLKKVIKDDSEYYTCCMNTEDMTIWYVLIQNLPDPYTNGEYIFKLKIPDDFPDNPPSLSALTPNGVMDMGGKICISLGEFHHNDYHRSGASGNYGWIPSLGISGFILQGIINAILSFDTDDRGVRLNNLTWGEKMELSKKSVDYNVKNNKYIMDLFKVHKDNFPNLKIYSQNV